MSEPLIPYPMPDGNFKNYFPRWHSREDGTVTDPHRDYGIALKRPCPYCGVDPGRKCVNMFGDVQPVPHYSRTPDGPAPVLGEAQGGGK